MENSKKRIIILVMSCNKDFFLKEELCCRECWAKPILDGEYENIDYFSYTGGNEKSYIDLEDKRIYCKSGDGLYETYQKTYEAIKLLDDYNIQYDYIFRTNTSTVINVGLLDYFVNNYNINENFVYCGELYTIGLPCPLKTSIYPRGNSVLWSKKIIDIIKDFNKYVYVPDKLFADDNIIGNIINVYHYLRFEDHRKYIKSYGFAWYKCYPKNHNFAKASNGISSFGNINNSYNYLKNFISIQIKSYVDRSTEIDKIKEISSIISNKKDDYTKELEFINKYMDNPKVYVYNRISNAFGYLDLYKKDNVKTI